LLLGDIVAGGFEPLFDLAVLGQRDGVGELAVASRRGRPGSRRRGRNRLHRHLDLGLRASRLKPGDKRE